MNGNFLPERGLLGSHLKKWGLSLNPARLDDGCVLYVGAGQITVWRIEPPSRRREPEIAGKKRTQRKPEEEGDQSGGWRCVWKWDGGSE